MYACFILNNISPIVVVDPQQSTDRSARRKERVERRLHQMEASSPPSSAVPPTTPPADATNDLAEFAKLYFNDHPRSPEGNLSLSLCRLLSYKILLLSCYNAIRTYF